jgi:hypothetical protein
MRFWAIAVAARLAVRRSAMALAAHLLDLDQLPECGGEVRQCIARGAADAVDARRIGGGLQQIVQQLPGACGFGARRLGVSR